MSNIVFSDLSYKIMVEPERQERKLRRDFVGLVGRDSILYFFDLRIISFKSAVRNNKAFQEK